MSTSNVYFDQEKLWDNNAMCVCGHKLMMHASTLQYDKHTDQSYLRTFQCISCPYDHENDKFTCECFEKAQNK